MELGLEKIQQEDQGQWSFQEKDQEDYKSLESYCWNFIGWDQKKKSWKARR